MKLGLWGSIRSQLKLGTILASGGAAAWTPATQLESTTPAIWAKPSDTTTIFQDNAKTTLAAANSDPIGCIADKSGNGADLISGSDPVRATRLNNALGGKVGAKFNGTTQYLTRANFFDSTFNKAWSYLLVLNADTNSAGIPIGNISTTWYLREFPDENWRNYFAAATNNDDNYAYVASGTGKKIIAYSYDGNKVITHVNNSARLMFTGVNLGVSGALGFGALSNGAIFYNEAIMELVGYKKGLSNASLESLISYGATEYGLTRNTITRKVFFVGDSLTWGTTASAPNKSYPDLFAIAKNSAALEIWNCGTPGYTAFTLATTTYQHLTALTGASDVAIVWLGTNDLASGRTAAQTFGDLTTICNAIRATGCKVALCTVIARGNLTAPQETARGTLNTNITTNYATIADYLVDLAADARLQNASDTTYYAADTIHLNDTGYGVVKDLVTTVYNTI